MMDAITTTTLQQDAWSMVCRYADILGLPADDPQIRRVIDHMSYGPLAGVELQRHVQTAGSKTLYRIIRAYAAECVSLTPGETCETCGVYDATCSC